MSGLIDIEQVPEPRRRNVERNVPALEYDFDPWRGVRRPGSVDRWRLDWCYFIREGRMKLCVYIQA